MLKILLSLFILLNAILQSSAQRGLGVLVAQTSDGTEQAFCIVYYPQIYNFTSERNNAESYFLKELLDLKSANTCDDTDTNIPESLAEKFVLSRIPTKRNRNTSNSDAATNCTILDRAKLIVDRNGSGLLVDTVLSMPRDETPDFTIPVAAILDSFDRDHLLSIAEQFPNSKFFIYAPTPDEEGKRFDVSLVVILVMAVATVMVGSFWSGEVKHYLRTTQLIEIDSSRRRSSRGPDDEERFCEAEDGNKQPAEEVSLRISPIFVFIFVILMCSMLVLLYFFFDKLVYVIIALFCLASTIAVYSCFEPLIEWTYASFPRCPTLRLPRCNMYICILNMELRQFLLLVLSMSVTAVWAVYRNEDWAWILQDILGILFSINMLKALRLPSFKICTVLLSALFIYDIFFVFITPLITKDGKSVMVEVATGGDSGEQLPMVLKVPHLGSDPLKVCGNHYSMLGYGDILVPGLLLSYCHSFDLLAKTPYRLYWILSCVAYTLGLIATFISLYLMNSAQPALLYLVPFTVIPVAVVSLVRGDFRSMWQGDHESSKGIVPRTDHNEVETTSSLQSNPTEPQR